jgi:hypothetical protein
MSLENQEAWVAPASSLLLDGSVVPISVNIPSVLDLSIRPRYPFPFLFLSPLLTPPSQDNQAS